MKEKVLITGASGFAGSFLAQHLLSLEKYDIQGTYLDDKSLQNSPIKNDITFHKIDLTDKEAVNNLISTVKPDIIYHLAAMAFVPASFKDPVGTFHNNVDVEIYLLEALRNNGLTDTRVLITASSEMYGYIKPDDLPVDEETPFRPASPYAVSKIAQDYLGFQYFISYKMPIIRVRPFNHIGPRQAPTFVVAQFSKQIADIEKGKRKPVLQVGNLDAKRDFTDVRDMVEAYTVIVEKGIPGEVYNIGSGISYKIKDVLDKLLKLSTKKITIDVDQDKMRPSDVPEMVCDNTKIQKVTGWKPKIKIDQTLRDTLDYWRSLR